jgi:hypothetical protein
MILKCVTGRTTKNKPASALFFFTVISNLALVRAEKEYKSTNFELLFRPATVFISDDERGSRYNN